MKKKSPNLDAYIAVRESGDKLISLFWEMSTWFYTKACDEFYCGEDKRMRSLLLKKVIIDRWTSKFQREKDFLEIFLMDINPMAVSNITPLTDAVAECRAMIKEDPNLEAIALIIGKVFSVVNDPDRRFSKFLDDMKKDLDVFDDDDLVRPGALDDREELREALYREFPLPTKSGGPAVPLGRNEKAVRTDPIDIAEVYRMIDEERKRK